MVSATIGPTPGASAKRRLSALALCWAAISVSSASISLVEPLDLLAQTGQYVLRARWHSVFRVSHSCQYRSYVGGAAGSDDAELASVAAHRVDQLGALLDQQLARTQHHSLGLPVG